MKKRFLLFITVLAVVACLFAMSVSAAEPSTSDEFGEVTILDHANINKRDDLGYSEGDTARVVMRVPNTDTYLTYPAYYIFNGVSKDNGWQAWDSYEDISAASGYAFDATCVIRMEIPNEFNKFSANYCHVGSMTSIKYVKFQPNMDTVFSFARNTSLETVIFEDNLDPEATLNIGSNAFENCTALSTLDLPVHWTAMNERSFAGCTSLTTIELSSRLETIGTAAFLNCTALETVVIPENNKIKQINHRAFDSCIALTSLSNLNNVTLIGSKGFYGCTSLTTLYGIENIVTVEDDTFNLCKSLTGTWNFESLTTLGYRAFNNCATNEGCAFILNFPSIVTLGGTSGDTNVFSNSTGIKEIYLGASLKNMSHNTFSNCTGLEKIEMAGIDSSLKAFPSYTFDGCTALKAFSIPEGITTLPNRMFRNCTSLTAVYLPSTLTTINSGSQDHATFANCNNMYLVSEPFTFTSDDDIPAKPDVYYFPANLETIANGEVFKKCQNLNSTLVFGKKVTSFPNAWAFEAGINNPTLQNIVFLGDMTRVASLNDSGKDATSYWKFTGKIYFANPADLSVADVQIKGIESKVVFCNAEGNTSHLKEYSDSREASCEMPKITADFCFCGQFIPGTEKTEGEALGHNYTGAVTYNLGGIMEEGTKCTVCVNNCGKDEIVVIPPVYVALGYSKNTFSNAPYSLVSGYDINRESLKIHEEEKNITIKLGFAFNSAALFTDGEVSLDSFALKAEVNNQTTDREFGRHEYVISYATEEHLAKDIIIGVFAVEIDGEGNKTYYFINRNEDATVGVNGFATVNYNSIN